MRPSHTVLSAKFANIKNTCESNYKNKNYFVWFTILIDTIFIELYD